MRDVGEEILWSPSVDSFFNRQLLVVIYRVIGDRFMSPRVLLSLTVSIISPPQHKQEKYRTPNTSSNSDCAYAFLGKRGHDGEL